MKIVVDFDECASNAVCMGIAPEVFEVRDDGFLYVLERAPRRGAAREGAPGGQRLPDGCHHHRRRRVTEACPGPSRGSASHRRPPATSTSAAPAPRLFNWLVARQSGGTFVLRIEDTDTDRNREEWVDGIISALHWLGMDPDEGPLPAVAANRALPTRPSTPYGRRVPLRLRLHPRADRGPQQGAPASRPPATTASAATGGLPRGDGRALRFRTPGRRESPSCTTWSVATSSSPASPWTTSWP